jgi:hypothetical protein
MAKEHRIEVRLGEEDYRSLLDRTELYGGSVTRAIEGLLRIAVPTKICGVRGVGVAGRRRFSVQFSNGMIIHGFLWSRGHQLLGPRVWNENGRWARIVDGSPEFWHRLRDLCEWELEPEPELLEKVRVVQDV